jgi:hypothetical protein
MAAFLEPKWKASQEFPEDQRKRYRFLLLAFTLNWRSFILGADGQGVEHSDIEAEAVRMALILAYGLEIGAMPSDIGALVSDLANLIRDISAEYWKEMVGNCTLENKSIYEIERFQGFKSPQSVVLVKAKRI